MAEFTADQQQALDVANQERRARGMPDWLPGEFVLANPMRFKGVDAAAATAKATPRPPRVLGSRRAAAAATTALAAANRERAIKGLDPLTLEQFLEVNPHTDFGAA